MVVDNVAYKVANMLAGMVGGPGPGTGALDF